MVKMECHRQKNYRSQDALCLEGTLKTLLYSGKMQIYKNVANKSAAEWKCSGVDTTVQQTVWVQCGGFTSGTTTPDPLRAGSWNKWRCVRWAVTAGGHAAWGRLGFLLVIRAISLVRRWAQGPWTNAPGSLWLSAGWPWTKPTVRWRECCGCARRA